MDDGKRLGIGIVGLGAISGIHIQAIRRIDKAVLKAVCSRDGQRTRLVALEEGCRWYTDYRLLASDPEVDVVILCTPSGTRLEMTRHIASCKKHVISEKPLETTPKRIDGMIEACKSNGVYLASIFHKRYHPVYKWIKSAVDSGRFGEITGTDVLMKWYRPAEYYSGSKWRGTIDLDGGGALMNQCVHFIDIAQWFNGGMKSVFAKTGRKLHKEIEAEDSAVAAVEYANGAFGVIEASTCSYPGFSTYITVNGSKGGIVCENERILRLELPDETDGTFRMPDESLFGEHGGDARTNVKQDFSLHLEQLGEAFNAILEGRQPPVEAPEARKAVEIITSMYESAARGVEIEIQSFKERG
ncbi:MAG: Gfo/Idh/MocA family oxidoreductase [Clostridia bacterium]|nr:Gfo/Idh/MocA family oxidoreductase [Clostridia bacterium]